MVQGAKGAGGPAAAPLQQTSSPQTPWSRSLRGGPLRQKCSRRLWRRQAPPALSRVYALPGPSRQARCYVAPWRLRLARSSPLRPHITTPKTPWHGAVALLSPSNPKPACPSARLAPSPNPHAPGLAPRVVCALVIHGLSYDALRAPQPVVVLDPCGRGGVRCLGSTPAAWGRGLGRQPTPCTAIHPPPPPANPGL